MVDNIGSRIKEVVDFKGITIKELSIKTGKSTTAIYEIFKKKDVSSEIIREFARILEVSEALLINDTPLTDSNTAIGTGVIAGSSNIQKVNITRKPSARQEVYGMGIDEIYINLIECRSEREILRKELDGVKNLLAAKEEMIAVLRGR